MSVESVVLVNSSNHQLLVNLSTPIMSVMLVTSTVLANSSKHLMLLNLSVAVMQVTLSFVVPLVSLLLILLVIIAFVNLFLWTKNILLNDLPIIKTVANMILKNKLVPWIFWWRPYFLYFIIIFAITMLTIFSKAMSGTITFLQVSF